MRDYDRIADRAREFAERLDDPTEPYTVAFSVVVDGLRLTVEKVR